MRVVCVKFTLFPKKKVQVTLVNCQLSLISYAMWNNDFRSRLLIFLCVSSFGLITQHVVTLYSKVKSYDENFPPFYSLALINITIYVYNSIFLALTNCACMCFVSIDFHVIEENYDLAMKKKNLIGSCIYFLVFSSVCFIRVLLFVGCFCASVEKINFRDSSGTQSR